MEVEPLEVYSRTSNYAIIKPPGRHYPGCVIQGDSLASLCRMAKSIATLVQNHATGKSDLLEDSQELANSLIDRILHYQEVLAAHGIPLPYPQTFSKDDLFTLLPDRDDSR
jgi:hypothetical protein